MAYFSGIGVHKDGFQVAHQQRVHVQLLAQAVHGNEVEMEIEFGEVEDFHRQAAPSNRGCAGLTGIKPVGPAVGCYDLSGFRVAVGAFWHVRRQPGAFVIRVKQ